MKPTTTYVEWTAQVPLVRRIRGWLRDRAVQTLSIGRRIDRTEGWIRFPFYHHVFDDERAGFERHLTHLRRFGDFISLDAAVDLLGRDGPIDGRYFCISFDDGLKTCRTGALPILAEHSIPAVFYVVSGMVGRTVDPDDRIARDTFAFAGQGTTLDFMTWDDCRLLLANGMTIGSHAQNHRRLAVLSSVDAEAEMINSRQDIERELAIECRHFCAPYGRPGVDFDPLRDVEIARRVGYRSFATGLRGLNRRGTDPFHLRRDQLLAGWDTYQLDYFLSQA